MLVDGHLLGPRHILVRCGLALCDLYVTCIPDFDLCLLQIRPTIGRHGPAELVHFGSVLVKAYNFAYVNDEIDK